MYDFECPYCSWGMNREDITDQVHEDDHVGEWDITCTHCKKVIELVAEPSINYSTNSKKAQGEGHE